MRTLLLPTSQKKDAIGALIHRIGIPTMKRSMYRCLGSTVVDPNWTGSGMNRLMPT